MADRTGVPPTARANRDYAIDACRDGPCSEPQRGDVVKDQATPLMNLRHHGSRVASRGHHDGDLVPPAGIQCAAACRGRHPDRDVRRQRTDEALRIRKL